MTAVIFSDVYKSYSDKADSGGVFGISLEVPDGRFTTLVGASGSGKTTLLRLLAGFLRPSAGEIFIGGEKVAGAECFFPPNRRDLAMVFQSYALWPHMTVYDNVAFGLRARKTPAAKIPALVAQALELVGLMPHSARHPGELSGGQQQRVALARSLVLRPRLLLLDEPLSNLDADLRVQMRSQLKELQAATGITFVYVTHDQDEAFALSDYLVVLEAGKVLQAGPPEDLYYRPRDVRVARFLNRGGLVLGGDAQAAGGGVSFQFAEPGQSPQIVAGLPASGGAGPGHLVLRAEALRLLVAAEEVPAGWSSLVGVATSVAFAGRENQVRIQVTPDAAATLYDPERRSVAIGQRVRIAFRPEDGRFVTA
jgi:ABC-type Fe3+/spermidine/putrescine transport system ATPase subunit